MGVAGRARNSLETTLWSRELEGEMFCSGIFFFLYSDSFGGQLAYFFNFLLVRFAVAVSCWQYTLKANSTVTGTHHCAGICKLLISS